MGINRRAFLGTILWPPSQRVLRVGIPLIGIGYPLRARAEPITIAIAVAAAVAGMIAAHNRGDGGLGAYLSALNRKLDIAIDQIASLQSSLAMVLTKLAALDDEIDEILTHHEIKNLHDAVFAAVQSYTKLEAARRRYETDDEFRNARGVLADINSQLERLEIATSTLIVKRAFGPASAAVIPSAFLLENSLLLLRGDRALDIAARLTASLNWLDRMIDPDDTSSIAYYRAYAVLRHNEYLETAQEHPLGQILGMKPGIALLTCAGIDDFRRPDGRRGPRIGPKERMFQNFHLEATEYLAEVPGEKELISAGFFALKLSRLDRSPVLMASDENVPENCSSERVNEEDSTRRANWLKTQVEKAPQQLDFESLVTIVDLINLERARISYATTSLTIVAQARTELLGIIADYEGRRP